MEKDKKIVQNDKNDEIKVFFLGESGVGKTSIIKILMGENFKNDEITTLTPYSSVKRIFLENKEHQLRLCQTVSQEKFRALARLFYIDSKIVIFAYEITSKKSFDELNYWIKDVEDKIGSNFVKGIIANKTDLFLYEQVSIDEGEKFAESKKAKFIALSAKDEGREKLESFIAELLKEYLQKEKMHSDYYFSNLNIFLTLYKWLDK